MKSVLVGTAGHIDHGKSSLVKALTGTDPDRLPEEKERGITIELGFAHGTWDGVTFSFVDVPGHERFVRTMVAGAHAVDVALFVVASDDGVMPQTREHLDILRFLGIRHGVIARTKADLVDEESAALVEDEIRGLVKGTFLENSPIVAVSAVTGLGLSVLKSALGKAAEGVTAHDPESAPARLHVDRVFAMKGFGPVVTGTLRDGRIREGDELDALPRGRSVRVRRMEVHGMPRAEAHGGERTSLNLSGVELADLARGDTLVAPDSLVPSRFLHVSLDILPDARDLVRTGARLRFHHGTCEVFARIGKTTRIENTTVAEVRLQEPLAVRRGDHFVLRRPSPAETVAGGRILDAVEHRSKEIETRPEDALRRLAFGSDADVASLLLAEAGAAGLDPAGLSRRLGLPTERAAAILASMTPTGAALQIAPHLFASASAASAVRNRVDSIFTDQKRSGAATSALSRSEFLERMAKGLAPAAAGGWLATLDAGGALILEADRVLPPGSGRGGLSSDTESFAARIAERYGAAGFEPPSSLDLAKELGTKPPVVEGLVSHLIKNGTLLRLSPTIVVHRAVAEGAAAKVRGAAGRTMSVADFRDLLGLTRKNLIPLLEWLDRQKVTRRTGDVRIVP